MSNIIYALLALLINDELTAATLKMDAAGLFETLAPINPTTLHRSQGYNDLGGDCPKNLTSHHIRDVCITTKSAYFFTV
jgi:hypothetical protein